MNFNPLYDYSNDDLSNEKNLTYWKFAELIKNLITLSSKAERQFEIIGYGAVADEMAIDFDSYYTSSYNSYLKHGLLTDKIKTALDSLDKFFDERNGDKCPEFWDDNNLTNNSDWETVRQMAHSILHELKMDDLEINFRREEKLLITENGKELISQMTKTYLEKKNYR